MPHSVRWGDGQEGEEGAISVEKGNGLRLGVTEEGEEVAIAEEKGSGLTFQPLGCEEGYRANVRDLSAKCINSAWAWKGNGACVKSTY